jgi:hypothetical protein
VSDERSMNGDGPIDSAAERAFKRRFGGKDKGRNKRDDYALDLFREAGGYLDDPARVNGILRELGKLYNPMTDAPIVDLATRRRIVAMLVDGDRAGAKALLDQCCRLYAPRDVGEGGEEWKISQD